VARSLSWKIPPSVRLTLLVVFLLLISSQCAECAQTLRSSGWDSGDILRRFKLMSPGSGWVTTGPPEYGGVSTHLYWTDDGGQNWRQLIPWDIPVGRLWQIFFVDRLHGWVLTTEALEPQENAPFYLLSTEDGGKHWRKLQLERSSFDLFDKGNIRYFPSQMFFSDSKHGWILWHWQLPLFWRDTLLGTSDGGRTWMRLDDPAGSGPLQFVSAQDGWIAGVAEYPESFGAPEDTLLWRTHDGGWNWKPVTISVPKNSAEEGFYVVAVRFRNMRDGMVAAGLQRDGVTYGFVNCYTGDGGKTWRFSQFNALGATPSISNEHIFWSVDRRETKGTLQMEGEAISFTLPAGLSQGGKFLDLDFLDDSNAWVEYRDGSRFLLLSTTDRGKTSRLIFPPQHVTGGPSSEPPKTTPPK